MPSERTVDAAMNLVAWKALPPVDSPDGLPVATHEGTLALSGLSLRVFQLSNGQRVIDADDMADLLGIPPTSNAPEGGHDVR